jgi:hypothetical protein
MNVRTRVRLGVVLAAVLALPVALVPATKASAGAVTPQFSYLWGGNAGTLVADVRLLRSGSADGLSHSDLTVDGYRVSSYDVTQDGMTEILAVCHGEPTICAGHYKKGGYPGTTWALVLIHQDPVYGVESRILASEWEGQPALTDDGSPVWMTLGTVYKMSFDYTKGAGSGADWAAPGSGNGSVVSTKAFDYAPLSTAKDPWYVDALTVSGDGTQVAVIESDSTTPLAKARVLAGGFGTGASGTYFLQNFTTGTVRPDRSTFRFVSGSQIAFNTYDDAAALYITVTGAEEVATTLRVGTMSAANATPVAAAVPAMANTYDLRAFGTDWYVWHDTAAAAVVTSNVGSTTDITVAPASWTARDDGGVVTSQYRPTSATPPAFAPSTVANRTPGRAFLSMPSVVYPGNIPYHVEDDYWQDPAQTTAAPKFVRIATRGRLYFGFTPKGPWHTTETPAVWVTDANRGAATGTIPLSRNTWFRWVYLGDGLTAPSSTSSTRLVRVGVIPGLGVTYKVSGSSRIVYGITSRIGGKIVLYRKVTTTRWTAVATVALTSKGAFNFGKRKLRKGSYKVVTVADISWMSATRAFTIKS